MSGQGEEPGGGRRLINGFKAGVGLVLALPFVIILLPLWYVHRWNEVRSGRPAPEAPWAVLMPGYGKRSSIPGPVGRRPLAAHDPAPTFDADSAAVSLVDRPPPGGVALVTGGGQRLGAAICRDLAALGYRVAVVYHQSAQAAEKLLADIRRQGGDGACFPVNLANPAEIIQLLNEVDRQLGPPELVINNAGRLLPTHLREGTWEGMEQLFKVNLQGPLWLSLRAAERMAGGGGQIINICDIWGERPLRDHAAYSASKAGLIMATRSLARDLAPSVRVNAIAPGAVLPPEEGGREDPGFRKILSRTPLTRHAGPAAVLQAVRYLLTARYVTGEVLHVDGGRHLV